MGCSGCYRSSRLEEKQRVISEDKKIENLKWLMEDNNDFLKYLGVTDKQNYSINPSAV